MARDENHGRELAPRSPTSPMAVPITPGTSIDLSWLPDDARDALLRDYTKGMLDISKKAHELHVDVSALDHTLKTLAQTTKDVTKGGSSVTITHTQESTAGRTEVIMGNTESAQSGKLSRSQTGEKDWTPFYIIGGLIAVVLIAAFMAN